MAGGLRLLHLKGYREDGGMDSVGPGTLDFPALLAAGAEVGGAPTAPGTVLND